MKVVAMEVIRVAPQYGYGWERSGQPIDVPRPFNVEFEVSEKVDDQRAYRWLVGVISEPRHSLNGLWVLIALRSRGSPPTYNVFAYEERPPFHRGQGIDPFCVPRAASGFATLET